MGGRKCLNKKFAQHAITLVITAHVAVEPKKAIENTNLITLFAQHVTIKVIIA